MLRGVHFDFDKYNIRPGDAAVLDEAAATLRTTRERLSGRASVQLFSAQSGTGVREAQDVLAAWLSDDSPDRG